MRSTAGDRESALCCGGEERYVDRLLAAYVPRRPDARAFALERRVLLVQTTDAIPIEISLAALPFEERVADRSTALLFQPGASITACSAEDLIVLKAFADRVQDWLDVEGIIVRQGAALRRAQLLEELTGLLELKEDETPRVSLERLFRKHRPIASS